MVKCLSYEKFYCKKKLLNKWLVVLIKETEPVQCSCFLVHDSGYEYFISCNNTAVLFATYNILVCYPRTSLSSSYCYLIVILLLSFILNYISILICYSALHIWEVIYICSQLLSEQVLLLHLFNFFLQSICSSLSIKHVFN